ncbi:MAG: hypothetical protein VXW65_02105, partial [Pseudomonadota bacterium]|nr:hypothetical protein [Pseudomonadota bacterium]
MKFQSSYSSRSASLARQFSPLALAVSTVLFSMPAWANSPLPAASLPLAGTIISNMAVGEYIEEGTTVVQTSRSNLVETTIIPVYAFRLEQDRTVVSHAGQQVFFSHELRNTGNATDVYQVTLADPVGGIEFADEAVYLDRNRDGIPDGAALTPAQLALISLQAGETLGLLVGATVPVGTAANTYADSLVLSAESTNDNTLQVLENNDSLIISDQAVIQVRKSFSVAQAPSGTVVTVSLNYENTTALASGEVRITDVLTDPRLSYQPNSATWSGGATVTDVAGGDSAGLDYEYDATSETVTAILANVPANSSGVISFDVLINSDQATDIPNVATVVYDPDNDPLTPNNVTTPTNTAVVQVPPLYGVEINGISTSASANPADNLVTVPSVSQGGIARFDNYVWNTGNITDTYNLTIGSSTVPAGSVVEFFRADGVTPILDSNGDGIPDTGALPVGESLPIVVQIRFPASYTGASAPHSIFPAAQSIASTPTNDDVEDRVGAVDTQLVDLFNTDPNTGVGNGNIDNAGAPLKTLTVATNGTVVYPISVTHTGTPTQYRLAADADGDFSVLGLPAGVTVAFAETGVNGDCSPVGNMTGQTRLLNDGETQALCAVVTVEGGTPATTVDLYFRAYSPTYVSTAAPTNPGSDIIKNALTITNDLAPALLFTPDLRGHIAPGGTIVYTHTIVNNGDTVIVPRAGAPFEVSNDQPGFITTLYLDANDNGVLDPADTLITTTLADLQPNDKIRIFAKVEAASGVVLGVENKTLIELYGVGDVKLEQVEDITTVSETLIRLTKLQALD